MQYAMTAAIPNPASRAPPAARAAGANATKIPAPTMDPSPIVTASKTPNWRGNAAGAGLSGLCGLSGIEDPHPANASTWHRVICSRYSLVDGAGMSAA
ncbi:hypothetical protein MTER_12240 [Mycolicibacter terrae]|uniref:Uncharacterized protein n=1 Tax=Mycolicibacter terrae TaxID=1788 RepID=A0AAD1HWH8_9MYCO|nr:hypothetical protein MTER_12240 [Mycolicibacter terrae]